MRADTPVSVAHDVEYPATTADLVATHGDRRFELADGVETVEEVIERLPPATFEGPDDLGLALQSALSRRAVGRVSYSDRDPPPPGSRFEPDPVSF